MEKVAKQKRNPSFPMLLNQSLWKHWHLVCAQLDVGKLSTLWIDLSHVKNTLVCVLGQLQVFGCESWESTNMQLEYCGDMNWVTMTWMEAKSKHHLLPIDLFPFRKCFCAAKHLGEKQKALENPLQKLFSSSSQSFIYSTSIYWVFIIEKVLLSNDLEGRKLYTYTNIIIECHKRGVKKLLHLSRLLRHSWEWNWFTCHFWTRWYWAEL